MRKNDLWASKAFVVALAVISFFVFEGQTKTRKNDTLPIGVPYGRNKKNEQTLKQKKRARRGQPKAGDKKSFSIPGTSVTLEMRWIPSGSFLMGSPTSEVDRFDNEVQHRVTLTQGFWMLETEVTQEMWESLMDFNPSWYKDSKRPVEYVTWYEVLEFITKLNSKGIGTFRLPTEAEWEYACRAGSEGAYCFGDSVTMLSKYAWYNWGQDEKQTRPVGVQQANAWGLYDMHGNVLEYCQDWYEEEYPLGSQTDPRGPAKGYERVLRGGSFRDGAMNCRSAFRDDNISDVRWDDIGFRLVRN